MKCLCSIIVLMYNSKVEKVITTLDSILKQNFQNFEIVIRDDGSRKNNLEMVRDYFRRHHFDNYKLIYDKVNRGTVENFYLAVKETQGKYIKPIGVGDLLYDEDSLSEMCLYMELEQKKIAFGLLRPFYFNSNNEVEEIKYEAPFDINAFIKKRNKCINRNIIVYGKYISGASLFFERTFIKDSLDEIRGKVIYCEDFVQVLALVKGEEIGFLNRNTIWYEMGDGISTSGNEAWIHKLEVDDDAFYKYANREYGYNKYIRRRIKRQSVSKHPKLLRGIYKLITEPYMFLISWDTKRQSRNGLYDGSNGIGFLNDKSKVNS